MPDRSSSPLPRPLRPLREWRALCTQHTFFTLLALCLLLSLPLLALFISYAQRELATDMTRTARNRLELYAGTLHSALNRHAYLPYILAGHPSIRRLVTHGDNLHEVNAYLREVNTAARSMEIFVLDATGLTIAASNWDNDESFMGHDYHYRPYFTETLRRGQTGYFAVGATTGKPGFFMSEQIDGAPAPLGPPGPPGLPSPLGVVVVKVDLSNLQREWRDGGETIFITDAAGVIFLSSRDAWRYKATLPLNEDTAAAMLYQRQYGKTLPQPIAMRARTESGADIMRIDGQDWLYTSRALTRNGWTLWFLSPLEPLAQRTRALWLFGGGTVIVLLLLALLARTALAWSKARRAALDAAEIRAVNLRLTEEIRNREKAERELLAAQDDLLHAGRMAALGQVAASVVHELSQPITSMGMFASSCRRLAQRDCHEDLAKTAEHMLAMVQRVKLLIEQLRNFSRKAPGKSTPVPLRDVLNNALTVLQFRQEAVQCTPRIVCAPDVMVMADALQLEQVCINLLSNALDAVDSVNTPDTAQKKVDVLVESLPGAVRISITDNGPGFDPGVRDKLFTPFFTTKKSGEGIGLGLAIVDNSVRSMRGSIEAHTVLPHGACFTIYLPQAAPDMPRE